MIPTGDLNALKGQLFCLDSATVFAVLDGASVPNLPASLDLYRPEHTCLLRGVVSPDMVHVAPYLVALERNAPFTDWLLLNGWGKNWGIFGISRRDLRALKRHFRRWVHIEHDGRPMYFRFYDPTVLRNYLPTCNAEELSTFFGPVRLFLFEDEDPETVHLFLLRQNVLQLRVVPLRDSAERGMADELADSFAVEPSREPTGTPALRPEQLKQLGQSIYVARMRRYLQDVFPETKAMPRKTLEQLIEELTERATGYKLVLETHVAPFIVAALILGMNFEDKYPVAQEVLLDYEMDCGRKTEWLWDFIEVTAVGSEDRQ
ncbi:DUF4123 domain-containing protein [Geomonas oryzisoli]|uniref:DUF4123 domain-containing protein n=1 Tax=Geomonas oryzisoli TaxID=2847992 RepID=A0ABX8J5K2_9BACT|nr:DUF4123 domain-containing protein [Geomonas oryzisoli]QWV91992.1 DUF4123 domain-containing protein [Geomonas oryzisoli]